MSAWAACMARAARPMLRSTSVLVCAFSRASRWNSTVDRVPSICDSCFSSRFFLFSACSAAKQGRSHAQESPGTSSRGFRQHQRGLALLAPTGRRQPEGWRNSGCKCPSSACAKGLPSHILNVTLFFPRRASVRG